TTIPEIPPISIPKVGSTMENLPLASVATDTTPLGVLSASCNTDQLQNAMTVGANDAVNKATNDSKTYLTNQLNGYINKVAFLHDKDCAAGYTKESDGTCSKCP